MHMSGACLQAEAAQQKAVAAQHACELQPSNHTVKLG